MVKVLRKFVDDTRRVKFGKSCVLFFMCVAGKNVFGARK